MTPEMLIYAVPAAGVLALLYALMQASWVRKQEAGTDEMKENCCHHVA